MADEESLSGVRLPTDPLYDDEAVRLGWVAPRLMLTQNDETHYGDVWSTMPRGMSTQVRTLSLGVAVYQGAVAAASDVVTKLRVFSGTAAAGTGTFRAAVYAGGGQSSLSYQATTPTVTSVAASSLLEFTLSANVALYPGRFVYVALLATGFSTVPTFQCMNGSGGPAGFISPSGRVWCGTSASGQTALPTTSVAMTSMTPSGNPHWVALL